MILDLEKLSFILFFSLILDRIIGDPKWIWRKIPHPIIGFGWVISISEKYANNKHFSEKKNL